MRIFVLFIAWFSLSTESHAQLIPCPEAGFTTFDTPKLIFPTQPVVGQTWSICYKDPGNCRLSASNTDPLEISSSTIIVRKSFLNVPFGMCPQPAYFQQMLPPPTQAGPLLVKYFWRIANSQGALANTPFELQEERVIHVLATDAVQQLPALDLKAMAGLTLLLAAFGWGAIRRFG